MRIFRNWSLVILLSYTGIGLCISNAPPPPSISNYNTIGYLISKGEEGNSQKSLALLASSVLARYTSIKFSGSNNNYVLKYDYQNVIDEMIVASPIGNSGKLTIFPSNIGGVPDPTEIYINDLAISDKDLLEIIGWVDHYLLYIKDNGQKTLDALRRIAFNDYRGELLAASWERLSNGYYQVFPKYESWNPPPAPEPSTYGAIFGGLGVLLALSRKRCCIWQNSAHSHQKRKDYRDD